MSALFGRRATTGMSAGQIIRNWHPNYAHHLSLALRARAVEARALRRLPEVVDAAAEPRPYVRFVVAAQARTGSSLLIRLLRQHPEVVAHSEILARSFGGGPRDYASDKWHGDGVERALAHRADGPLTFLTQALWPPHVPARAVGCKTFAEHSRREQVVLGPFLANVPDLRVIRLTRRDRLAQVASYLRASRDDTWMQVDDRRADPAPIELDPQEVLAQVNHRNAVDEQLDRQYSRHEVLRVTYEDLAEDPSGQAARAMEFLGVEPVVATPTTRKTSSRPLHQDIANFEELDRLWRGTRWEYLTAPHRPSG